MPSVKEWALLHEDLLQVLFYNADTGIFTWQVDVGGNAQAGDQAGSLDVSRGYRKLTINGFSYKEHRLAFFYMSKAWPMAEVDHINGVKDDNRWSNLREASREQNTQNARRRRDNIAGYKGVHFHKMTGRFQAAIQFGKKRKYLGLFDTAEAASEAYEAAAKEQFGVFFPDKLN